MLGRRFLLLVVVLMGLTALAATIAPREPLIRDGARRTATPTPTPAVEATAATPVHEVSRTLMITANPGRITVKQGTLLELTVKGDKLGNLSLMDQVEPIERDSPAVFNVLADTPDAYPIVMVDENRVVGTLVVKKSS
jgi:hypothetical protein